MDELLELGPLRPVGLSRGDLEDRLDYKELSASPRLRLRSCPSPRMYIGSPRNYRRFKNKKEHFQLSPESPPLNNANVLFPFGDQEKVSTSYGTITVGVQGDRRRPAMITYHDIGLNANSCFQSFFQFSDMAKIAERFCVFHINAPGQEEAAEPLPSNYVYPSLEDLAQMIVAVVDHFQIKSFVGFGVGVGANIFIRYGLKNSNKVDALILVNAMASKAGWMEWGYQKVNMNYLRNRGVTAFTVDYLLWYHFGKHTEQVNPDLYDSYRAYFAQMPHPSNLAPFIDAHLQRTPIAMLRTGPTLHCPVLQVVGSYSPHLNDTVDVNSRLDPTKSDWMKVSDASGLVLEEQPSKVTEAIILFLQGYGHFPSISHAKWVQSRSASVQLDTAPFRRPTLEKKRTSLGTIPDVPVIT